MFHLKIIVLAVLMLFCAGSAQAQRVTDAYACGFAKVKLTSGQSTFVRVRAGPGRKFPQIDKLRSGQIVYICNGGGGWSNIFYSDPDGPCGSPSESGLNVHKAQTCRSGWMEEKYVDVISG